MRCSAALGGALCAPPRVVLAARCASAPLLRRRALHAASPPRRTVSSVGDAELYTPRCVFSSVSRLLFNRATPLFLSATRAAPWRSVSRAPLPESRASVSVLPPAAPPVAASVAASPLVSWPVFVALLLAACTACASTVSLFLLAMWPTLKARAAPRQLRAWLTRFALSRRAHRRRSALPLQQRRPCAPLRRRRAQPPPQALRQSG